MDVVQIEWVDLEKYRWERGGKYVVVGWVDGGIGLWRGLYDEWVRWRCKWLKDELLLMFLRYRYIQIFGGIGKQLDIFDIMVYVGNFSFLKGRGRRVISLKSIWVVQWEFILK